jgi:hypothetical protein
MLSPIPAARALPDFANTNVWRAGELGSASVQTIATAYAALDAVLPGGGWPQGALIEVLQPQAGVHEWGLVAPALAALQARALGELTVLVGAPWLPFGPALGARRSWTCGACSASRASPATRHRCSGPRAKPCNAPTCKACWPGCPMRAAPMCAACRSRPMRTTSCCLSSGPCGRSMNPRPRRCACGWRARPARRACCGSTCSSGAARRWPRRCCSTPGRPGWRRCWRPAAKGRGASANAGVLAPLLLPSRVSLPLTSRESHPCVAGSHCASRPPLRRPSVGPLSTGRRLLQRAVASLALGLTPRVALVDEAVLMDVTGSLRLFGGLARLMQLLAERLASLL